MSNRHHFVSPNTDHVNSEDQAGNKENENIVEEEIEERAVAPVDAEEIGEPQEATEVDETLGDGTEEVGDQEGNAGDEDLEAEEEAERPRALRDPGKPTRVQIDEQNLTHIPFRPWCAACVRAKAKNRMSLKICGAYFESLIPRVRLDYCYLTEHAESASGEHGEEETTKVESSVTALVMQESTCRSVWAYAI